MYTYGRFMLRFDQKQNNSVKQLSMKKKKKKEINTGYSLEGLMLNLKL